VVFFFDVPQVVICQSVSLVDWTPSTRSKACTGLQSPVKCLDNSRFIVIQHTFKQGCVRPCLALRCIEMHLGGYVYSHGK